MDNLKPHRFAIIDFGSNTVRLVVMSAIPGYSYRLEDEIREVVRLRQGMTEEGLSDEAMARAFSTLRLFKRFCDSTGVDTVLATATSAVREAANGEEFVERIEREIGLKLQIIEGESEAYYGVLGALNEMPLSAGAVLDIGGGSAQISQVEHDCAAYKTLFKGGEEKLLICLSAILRLAEFMGAAATPPSTMSASPGPTHSCA